VTSQYPTFDPAETADVVVVGGGSAGAVLAARLSQDPARTVLLLEAGHAYAPDAYPPALLDASKIADPDHDWGYTSRGTGQAQIPTPRGKVPGAEQNGADGYPVDVVDGVRQTWGWSTSLPRCGGGNVQRARSSRSESIPGRFSGCPQGFQSMASWTTRRTNSSSMCSRENHLR
jgi:hypothetical protein